MNVIVKINICFLLYLFILLVATCDEGQYNHKNNPPEILEIRLLGTAVPISGSDTLVCQAIDPDNDSLYFEWEASAGSLSTGKDTVIWFAPEVPAKYPIICTVRDDEGGYDIGEVEIQVFDYDTLFIPHERLYPNIRMPRDTMMIITSELQYYELWEKYHSSMDGYGNPIPPPNVNFDNLVIAAVSNGYGGVSGCENDVTFIDFVYSIRDSVFIQLTNRGWYELGNCDALVEPRHWVTIPKMGLPIRFIGSYKR